MGASAPNFSVTGFQISVVRKASLKCASAGQPPRIREIVTPPSSRRTSNAATNVAARNARSMARSRELRRAAAHSRLATCILSGPFQRTGRPRDPGAAVPASPTGGNRKRCFAGLLVLRHGGRTLDGLLPGDAHLLDERRR